MVGVLVGATDEELATRKAAMLDSFAIKEEGQAWFARREANWIIGTPDQARRRRSPSSPPWASNG